MSILRSGRRALALLAGVATLAGYAVAAEPKADAADAPKATAEPTAEPKKDPKGEAAKIGDHVITNADVDAYVDKVIQDKIAAVKARNPSFQVSPAALAQARTQVGKTAPADLVRQYLVDQKLTAAGKDFTDAEVDKKIEDYKELLKMQRRDLADVLEELGKSESELKHDFRLQMGLEKVMKSELDLKEPTEKEITGFYDQNKDKFVLGEAVRARHILVGFASNPRDPQAKPATADEKKEKLKTANEVLEKVKKGDDFAKLAAQYSADPGSKDRGGKLKLISRGDTVPPFEKACFEAKPGDLVGPVESDYGYHIIKVDDHLTTHKLTLAEMHYQIEQQILGDAKRELYPKFLSKLQKDSKIELASGEKMPDPEEQAAQARKMQMQGGPGGPGAGAPPQGE